MYFHLDTNLHFACTVLCRSVGRSLVGSTNGDSFYEYLIKMYILWGDVYYWDMFMQAYSSIQVQIMSLFCLYVIGLNCT